MDDHLVAARLGAQGEVIERPPLSQLHSARPAITPHRQSALGPTLEVWWQTPSSDMPTSRRSERVAALRGAGRRTDRAHRGRSWRTLRWATTRLGGGCVAVCAQWRWEGVTIEGSGDGPLQTPPSSTDRAGNIYAALIIGGASISETRHAICRMPTGYDATTCFIVRHTVETELTLENANPLELAAGGEGAVYLRYGDRLMRIDLPSAQ
jgi:hypothetical protein